MIRSPPRVGDIYVRCGNQNSGCWRLAMITVLHLAPRNPETGGYVELLIIDAHDRVRTSYGASRSLRDILWDEDYGSDAWYVLVREE